ncbi:MAG: hypothetical protein JNL61_20940 [Rhizobiaceae bacterium]|nr:hypothetical protein [Rhizobiaceae bacterium]
MTRQTIAQREKLMRATSTSPPKGARWGFAEWLMCGSGVGLLLLSALMWDWR